MTELKRKTPQQARARTTIETLLDTTAQILSKEGGERLTTNYLAEKSGYSVGTVYQYFPHREALVLALIERQRATMRERVVKALETQHDSTVEQKILCIVRIVHGAFNVHRNGQSRLVHALLRHAIAHGLPEPADFAARAIIDVWQQASQQQARPLNDSEVFVLSAGLTEVLRRAALQGSKLLGTEQFEQAVLRMIMGFLKSER